jgi:hypothetical protein
MRRSPHFLFLILVCAGTSGDPPAPDGVRASAVPGSRIRKNAASDPPARILAHAATPAAAYGIVRDERGPAAGARVRFQGDPRFVLSDAQGRFRLPHDLRLSGLRPVAWKEGYFIAGASADPVALAGMLTTLSPLLGTPLCSATDRLPIVLRLARLPSADCADYRWVDPAPDPDAAGNCGNCHGAIYREWRSSGHARAATGGRFRNLYDGTDWRGRKGVGWSLLADHPDGAGVCASCHAPTVPFGDPGFFDLREVKGVAAQGVHCDYCHKVVDAPATGLGVTHGRYGLKLLRPKDGQIFAGPLDDVDRGEDLYAPLYRESRYCASCHEGTVFGVHVYGTYSEWLASPARTAGKQCQTCHMTATGTLTNMAPGRGGIARDPQTLGNHRFFTGSKADMLCACLKVSADVKRTDGGLRTEVTVRADDVGHRVPTGFVDRNLILVVEGLGPHGKPLPARTGPALPAAVGRDLAGLPGRLYARLLHDSEGHSPVPFWRADPKASDTRLVPGRPDVSVYTFPAAVERVRVRLLYRRFWQDVADRKGWPDNEIVVLDKAFRP